MDKIIITADNQSNLMIDIDDVSDMQQAIKMLGASFAKIAKENGSDEELFLELSSAIWDKMPKED